jgi:hypothetical protein
MEAGNEPVRGTYENVAAIVATLESAGVEFLNGDSPGVRLRAGAKSPSPSKPASRKQAKPAAKPARSRAGKRKETP